MAGPPLGQLLEPEGSSFAGLVTSPAAPRHCAACTSPGRGRAWEACPHLRGPALFRQLTQRAAEPHSWCDWHLCAALILRGRRLSACSSIPTAFVETDHPQAQSISQASRRPFRPKWAALSPDSSVCSRDRLRIATHLCSLQHRVQLSQMSSGLCAIYISPNSADAVADVASGSSASQDLRPGRELLARDALVG